MMKVPFHKPYITDEEISEVVNVIRSGWLTMGPKTLEFEERFKNYIFEDSDIPENKRFTVAVSSCTAALHLALKAVELEAGDEVIIPTNTFVATAEVVTYFNAIPVLCDIEKNTHNIDVSKIERLITKRTKAIIPVHFAGQPCDMEEIRAVAEDKKLTVIEDAAHALPAFYKGRKIGTTGDITCFSFYVTKTLTTGEGGMVVTKNEKWAERISTLRLHGISKNAWMRYSEEGSWYYEVVEQGFKYNMTDIQAALGVAQLKKVEFMWEKRRKIAAKYTDAFKNSKFILPPFELPDRISAYHLYVIKLNLDAITVDRSTFIEQLKKKGVGTSVHFIPIYRHPFYRKIYSYNLSDFPVSEWVYERCISLPIYPEMSDDDVTYVIESVIELCKKFER